MSLQPPLPDDDAPAPLDVPGLPAVARHGAGSASGWQYSEALGEAIADQYAESTSGGLWELRALAPERIPPPAVVRAWCRQFPAFGLLMREADRLRAEQMMEQTLVIADTGVGQAPRLALQIATRQHLAGKLDGARYGKGEGAGSAPALGRDQQPTALDCDDATLTAIALAGQTESVPR